MSRIGRMPIEIPEHVKIDIDNQKITISGPSAILFLNLRPEIGVKKSNNQLKLEVKDKTKLGFSISGLTRTLIQNAILGVTRGFEKRLEIRGVGYKASKKGEDLVLEVGFSHPVTIKASEGIEFQVQKNQIIVLGPDKEQVGGMAAYIRNIRKVEPYKGKGIRYINEIVRKKAGKKAKVAIGETASGSKGI
jgi:large subunit ribosomal protein L6